jgi:hypothetical protein
MLKLMVLMSENQTDCHRSMQQRFRVLENYGTGSGLSRTSMPAKVRGGGGLSIQQSCDRGYPSYVSHTRFTIQFCDWGRQIKPKIDSRRYTLVFIVFHIVCLRSKFLDECEIIFYFGKQTVR